MRKKKSVIAIVGPTASGKSELAVRLAKRFNGEIISADSRQVYHGLAIGSGIVRGRWLATIKSQKSKVKTANQNSKLFFYKAIPHHCIDYVSPKKRYTVVDFQKCARKAISDIHARGKIPFLVGGTGFYIDAVLGNTSFPSAPANLLLRKRLEHLPAEKLFAMLKKKDERRAATIDPRNKRRLIRALEIISSLRGATTTLCRGSDAAISLLNHGIAPPASRGRNDIMIIGIKKEKEKLRNAIAKRVRAMLKHGLLKETKKLHAQGLSWNRITEFGFEYRLPALFLQKKISRKELEERLIKENWHYAKRQMAWWRRNKNIHWISPLQEMRTLLTKALK